MFSDGVQGGISQPEERTKLGYFSVSFNKCKVSAFIFSGVAALNKLTGQDFPMANVREGTSFNASAMSILFPKW